MVLKASHHSVDAGLKLRSQSLCAFTYIPVARSLTTLTLLLISLFLVACSGFGHSPGQSTKVRELIARDAELTDFSIPIRYQAMRDTSLRYGAQHGLAARALSINKTLERREASLHRIFNFNALLLPHNLLPPVLVESSNTLNLDSPDAIRLADRVYKIVAPARFVTSAPSWRDYLWLGYVNPEEPDMSVMPRSKDEREVWDKYIKQGWINGVDQANQIFSENLGRLNRDYVGMVLYGDLLVKHMVSPPYVAKAKLGVTGDANEMHVNDQIVRITGSSMLQPKNSKDWQPALVK